MFGRLHYFLLNSTWSTPKSSRRSCLILLFSWTIFLLSLMALGYIYIHTFLPNYNIKRLSRYPLICSTVENKGLSPSECEIPWVNSTKELVQGRSLLLFENDDEPHSAVKLRTSPESNLEEEKHFSWSSCGEFCSPEEVQGQGCRQIKAEVRKPGSTLRFQECGNFEEIQCPFLRDNDGVVEIVDSTMQKGGGGNKGPLYKFYEKSCSTKDDEEPCLRAGIFQCKGSSTQGSTSTTTRPRSTMPPKPQDKEGSTTTNAPSSTPSTPRSTSTKTPDPVVPQDVPLENQIISSTPPTPLPVPNPSSSVAPEKPEVPTNVSLLLNADNGNTKNAIFRTTTLSEPPHDPLIKARRKRSPPTTSGLICSRIESYLSCNLTKMDDLDGYALRKFNCSNPSSPTCISKEGPGTYLCDSESWCRKISRPSLVCVRTCPKIPLDDRNILITDQRMSRLFTGKCGKALNEKGREVWPAGIKHKDHSSKWRLTPQIIVACNNFVKAENKSGQIEFLMTDCFNGTRFENTTLPLSLTLRELETYWHDNLLTEDFHLDPIHFRDAAPVSKLLMKGLSPSPIYSQDFYMNQGKGCESRKAPDKCPGFYDDYGKLPLDLRGQSVYFCYCRVKRGPGSFCVVAGEDSLMLGRHWEEGLVDFVNDHYIILIILVCIVLLSSCVVIGGLLYPLVKDDKVKPSLTNNPRILRQSPSVRSVKFLDVSPNKQRSRSNSLASVM